LLLQQHYIHPLTKNQTFSGLTFLVVVMVYTALSKSSFFLLKIGINIGLPILKTAYKEDF